MLLKIALEFQSKDTHTHTHTQKKRNLLLFEWIKYKISPFPHQSIRVQLISYNILVSCANLF